LDKRGVVNSVRMDEIWCQGGGVKDELDMGWETGWWELALLLRTRLAER